MGLQVFSLTESSLGNIRTKFRGAQTLLRAHWPKTMQAGEIRLRRPNMHVFVGYNDINPVLGDRILSHAWNGELRRPLVQDSLELGYFDTTTKDFHQIASTTTWCWQMGARLRWAFGGLSFNSIDSKGRAVLMAASIEGGPTAVVAPFAMIDVSLDQKLGLALSFSALERYRPGYGYSLSSFAAQEELKAVGRGLVVWGIEEQEVRSFITEEEIQRLTRTAYTYLNHASFSPTAEQFLVFAVEDRATGRLPKLLLGDTDSGGRRVRVSQLSMVSHFAWLADDIILVWGRSNIGEPGWFAIRSAPGETRLEIERLPIRNTEDAHATVIDADHVLLDRYPDARRMQSVEIVNIRSSRTQMLLRSYLPPDFRKDLRCDLHVRVSNASHYVIDDVDRSRRVIRLLPLNRPNSIADFDYVGSVSSRAQAQ